MLNKRHKVAENSMVVQGKGIITSDMDGEKVMLSIQNGKYYNLGNMGGEIWGLMDKPITISEVVRILLSRFDVDQATCEEQVFAFLEHLSDERLIEFH